MSSVTQSQADDAVVMSETLVNASDVAAFALVCWLIALSATSFSRAANSQLGHWVAGSFYALGAASALCVSSRLFKAHYKDHGTRLIPAAPTR